MDTLPGYMEGRSRFDDDDDDDLFSEGCLSMESLPVFSESDESTACTHSEGYPDEQWGVDLSNGFVSIPQPQRPAAPYAQQPRRSLLLRSAATGAGSAETISPASASPGKVPVRVSALVGDEWDPLLLDALFRPIDGSDSDSEDEWLDEKERQDFLDMSKRMLRSLVPAGSVTGSGVTNSPPSASPGNVPLRVSALVDDEWDPLLLDALFRPIDGSDSDSEDIWVDEEEKQDFLDVSKTVLRSLVPRQRA